MAITVQGKGGAASEVDGTGFRALRVTLRPVEYGLLGAYAYGSDFSNTFTMTAHAAAAEIYQFRYVGLGTFGCVYAVWITGYATAGAVTVSEGFLGLEMIAARNWDITASALGVTWAQNILKLRSAMSGTRVGTTAALSSVHTPGTKILDANRLGVLTWECPGVTNTNYPEVRSKAIFANRLHPLVCGTRDGYPAAAGGLNPYCEGFVLRWTAANNMQGHRLAIYTCWSEVSEF
jgi:hypothetical protein